MTLWQLQGYKSELELNLQVHQICTQPAALQIWAESKVEGASGQCLVSDCELLCVFVCRFVLGLSWVVGDAEELPFDDDQFDIYTIAFGIRNVTHIDQVTDSTFTIVNAQNILLKKALQLTE